jgi:protein required for attachment to host cells
MRTVRVVVADQSQARFFDSSAPNQKLKPAGTLLDTAARKQEQELGASRPGSAMSAGHGHYALQHRSSRKRLEVGLFAKQIAAKLAAGASAGEFDDIALVAAPRFLGALRKVLPPALRNLVKHEIHHDLVHQSEAVIREHLPEHW